jgi:hypothetical protein
MSLSKGTDRNKVGVAICTQVQTVQHIVDIIIFFNRSVLHQLMFVSWSIFTQRHNVCEFTTLCYRPTNLTFRGLFDDLCFDFLRKILSCEQA